MKLNIKLKEIFFLSILLLLLPVRVNAEDAESLNSDVGLETNAVENTVVQDTKVDISSEDGKIEAIKENSNQDTKNNDVIERSEENQEFLEEDLSQDTKDNEVIEDSEENLEENLSQDIKDNEVIEDSEEKQENLKNDEEVASKNSINTSDSEELEIEEEKIPEALGGGSSGGSGSGYVSSSVSFAIIKKDENGNPMQVAFKITNLITGESHILVTGPDGISNHLELNKNKEYKENPGELDISFLEEDIYHYIPKDILDSIISNLHEKDIDSSFDGKPNIFGPLEKLRMPPGETPPLPRYGSGGSDPGNSTPPPDSEADQYNNYDIFLQAGRLNDLYEYKGPKKDFITQFSKKNIGKGNLKVSIEYELLENSSADEAKAKYSESFEYENLSAEKFNQYNRIKLYKYATDKLAKLVKEGNLGNEDDRKPESVYRFKCKVVAETKEYVSDVYKIEELRTDTNKGYSLKTFYVKKEYQEDWQEKGNDPNKRYKFFMGYSEDNFTEEAQYKDLGMCPPPIDPGYGPGQVPPPKMPPLAPRSAQVGFELGENIVPAPLGGGSSGGSGSGYVSSEQINPMCMPTPTFTIVNEKFDFNTYASHPDQSDNKILVKSSETRVTDKIKFDKLSEGKEYRFEGKLIHKTTGEVVKTKEPIIYETGKLTSAKGEASITITFDSSAYNDGDEFVLIYDIYEDGLLAGSEDDLENKDQTFSIIEKEVPPPPGETPPPEKEVPPPKEETPPPKEVPPSPKEEIPPVEESKEEAKVVEEKTYSKPTPDYIAPKTYDSGIGLNIIMLALSGAGFTLLRKKNK